MHAGHVGVTASAAVGGVNRFHKTAFIDDANALPLSGAGVTSICGLPMGQSKPDPLQVKAEVGYSKDIIPPREKYRGVHGQKY